MSMDVDEARRRLAEARVARMATVDVEGSPHVVPVVFAVEGSTMYWAVDRKPKRTQRVKRLDNLRKNPAAQLMVDHFEEDWGALWWVRATGRARTVEAGEERRHALALLARKYVQYRVQPPPGPVVAIDIDRISSWEAAAQPGDER